MILPKRIPLVLAPLAVALAPATASAMPFDALPTAAPAPSERTTEAPGDGGQTLALILSGAALVVAAGAAARTVSVRPATAGPAVPTSLRPGAQLGR